MASRLHVATYVAINFSFLASYTTIVVIVVGKTDNWFSYIRLDYNLILSLYIYYSSLVLIL